jgi:hypothetical protein
MSHTQLQALQQALAQLRTDQIRPAAFADLARQQQVLLAALPPKFGEVLHGLLDRLESGALFDAESCSFSQSGLHDSLQMWLDKAQDRLDSPTLPGT